MEQTKQGRFDLTSGKILNKLLLVAIPIMGSQLMQMLYNLTDMFWLGRVNSDAVAASGSAGMYMWLSGGLLMIGRMGAEIGVSQNLGKGDTKSALLFSQNSLFLALVTGVLFGGGMIVFRHPLIGFFQIQDPAVASSAAVYLAVAGISVPMTFLSGAATGAFNGSGNSRVPFFIHTIGLVTNMVLDPLLILTLNMGILGAAVATSTAQALVCVLFLIAIKRSKSRPFKEHRLLVRPDKDCIRQIFKWSIPISLESILFTVLSMFISRFVAAWGTDAMAVQRVGSQIESLSWLIGGGFSSALTAFVGQNYGAGKWGRIRRGFRISALTMLVWGIVITGIMFFGAGLLFSLFLREADLIAQGVVYLRILSVCQVIACLEYLSSGAFRGIGRTTPPSVVSITSNAIRVPLAYLLSRTSLGIVGIWWGITLGAMLRGAWMFLWYLIAARKQPTQDAAPAVV